MMNFCWPTLVEYHQYCLRFYYTEVIEIDIKLLIG